MNQNVENNNINPSNNNLPANATDKPNGSSSTPNFGNMTNEQMQNYLISKFQEMTVANVIATDKKTSENQYFFQNSKAFPNIPPLINHYSDSELASLLNQQGCADKSSSSDEFGNMAQAMSIGHSENSLYSSTSTSKDSSDSSTSDEILPYIMPLSHNGTLTATGEDGRVRVIVPVSPSPSTSGVGEPPAEVKQTPTGATLKVPGAEAPTAPITRSTSEKVPNRSEMMAALRSQWTRHTTK
ncbi:jg1900 [Pararge aegeria aegeria]|uniref:Jg1900 protein n=1 Tax=Pararge aegeria aegeria TaxID=348720 RepID=A0A8S4QKE9_9NEOP|nr:jg1900 [Pararge aegeria aegeria]